MIDLALRAALSLGVAVVSVVWTMFWLFVVAALVSWPLFALTLWVLR